MQSTPLNQKLTTQPVCSICIANFNGMGMLDKCLKSLMQQDFDHPIEIIVHDDASTDESVDFIRKNFPKVVLIASESNVGFCVSNNRMVKMAQGKYILLLNNDAILYLDALKTFHEYAKALNKPAVLGVRQYDASTGDLIDFGIFLDPFMNSVPNQDFQKTDVAMVIGACLWIPKTLWDEIGGFPDWFHTMHEDMYICCMARLYGYTVRVVSESGYKHWVGKSIGGGKVVGNRLATTFKRRFLSERNRLSVMVMCYPNPILAIILPLHLVMLLFEGTVLAVIKGDIKIASFIYLSSIGAFWGQRKKLLSMRQKIQNKRAINSIMFLKVFNLMPHKFRMFLKHGFPEIT